MLVVDLPATRRAFAAAGAFGCAAAIALSAYAAHGLDAADAARLQTPLAYLLLHGLALAVFAPRQRGALELAVLCGWTLGTLLFSGSLLLAVLAAAPSTLAPFGGGLLIGAWLLQALAAARRR